MTVLAVMPGESQRGGEDPSPDQVVSYITGKMEERWGEQLPGPDPQQVISGFCDRFGPGKAMAIARVAFGKYDGVWCSAPVTIRRFTDKQDGFFADRLLAEAQA